MNMTIKKDNFGRIPIELMKNLEWSLYKKRKCRRLKSPDFSIIASNCVGTFIYYDLGLPFHSPTINLTIGMNDFVKFAENLEWYLEKNIIRIKGDYKYPTGMLEDIRINFVHYKSFEESVEKWEERKKRINWANLFFMGAERDDCTYETVQRFDKLPYRNKVIFTHKEYPQIKSAYCIKGFEKEPELGQILEFKNQLLKRRYLDDFDYVSFLNSSV